MYVCMMYVCIYVFINLGIHVCTSERCEGWVRVLNIRQGRESTVADSIVCEVRIKVSQFFLEFVCVYVCMYVCIYVFMYLLI